MHHPNADIDRLYVKRKEGGRGLLQVEAAYRAEIINTAEHLKQSTKQTSLLKLLQSMKVRNQIRTEYLT
jgi:hypothetical protein